MWCAPTNPGPTRPMPMRRVTTGLPSRQRRLRERHALLHFLDRRAGAAILVLDVGANRPLLLLQELQRLANRRVALPPRHVVALVLLAVLEVQVRDVGVVLPDVVERVEVGRGEVADVEVHLEQL